MAKENNTILTKETVISKLHKRTQEYSSQTTSNFNKALVILSSVMADSEGAIPWISSMLSLDENY